MKAGGRRVAWLSDANRNLLRNPRAAMRPPAGPPDATMSRTGMTADSSATTAMPTARLAPVMPAAMWAVIGIVEQWYIQIPAIVAVKR